MDHKHLGRSGLRVSRLCLGTMNFGDATDEPTAFAIMDQALEAGIDFVDTADVYGGPQSPDMEQGYGISEEIIGRSTPWEEIWQAMDQLIREGKVTYIGSSNFAGWDIATAQVELEMIPALRYYGIGLIPWSPLAGGLLGGVLRKTGEGRRAGDQIQRQIEQHRSRLERYEALCSELGEQPADVALAWLLHNPAVTATIIGPRTTEQLTNSRRALEISLSGQTLDALDDIWPGPGGEAPQAYAW